MIHIYTGNGKGKSTAAMGLAVRALGAGMKVWLGQFLKTADYSEHKLLSLLENIDLFTFGSGRFIIGDFSPSDLAAAEQGWEKGIEAINSNAYQLVILDEIITTINIGMLDIAQIIEGIKAKQVEIVLTGRNASEQLIAAADLVTEMAEIKHYYRTGTSARVGIEM